MRRMIAFVCCLCLVMVCLTAEAPAGEQSPYYIHYLVVPTAMPDGTDASQAIETFKGEVLKLTTGFTQLGPSRGGSLADDGTVKHQDNMSYLIGADRDISQGLREAVMRLFRRDSAFILVWQGKAVF